MTIDYDLRSAELSLGVALAAFWLILWRASIDTILWPFRLARYLYRRATDVPRPPLGSWGVLDTLFLVMLIGIVLVFVGDLYYLQTGVVNPLITTLLGWFAIGMICGIPMNYSKIYHPYVADDETDTLEW